MSFLAPHAPTRPTQAAYTLTELAATVAIVLILAGMAVPALAGLIARHRLANIGNDLLGLVTLARNEALQRQRRVTLCRAVDPAAASPLCAAPEHSWNAGILVFVDDGSRHPPQPARAADILRIGTAVDVSYTVQRKGLNTPFVSFGPNGRLKSGTLGVSFDIAAPATAIASELDRQRCLVIATTGRTRLLPGRCE